MATIKEIYPDMESVKKQAAVRKKFGWNASVEINERGVFEVTFTRDETTSKNKKLKAFEDDFLNCSVAADYIERYKRVYADKKKFKAFSTIVIIVLIYCMIQLGVMALVSTLFKVMYSTNPSMLYDLGLNVTAGGSSTPLTPDWKFDLNIEEIGLSGVFLLFGISGPILTLTVELLINALFTVGMICLAGLLLILFFMIRKIIVTKTFYKAEVEYINRRKNRLNNILDDVDKKMDKIMRDVKKIEQ